MLSNGSVLVVGGEVGSNGAPEPSLEILPTPAGDPTWKFLDYLNRTDPNNLYPFLHMLPSGRIFIGWLKNVYSLEPDSLRSQDTTTKRESSSLILWIRTLFSQICPALLIASPLDAHIR